MILFLNFNLLFCLTWYIKLWKLIKLACCHRVWSQLVNVSRIRKLLLNNNCYLDDYIWQPNFETIQISLNVLKLVLSFNWTWDNLGNLKEAPSNNHMESTLRLRLPMGSTYLCFGIVVWHFLQKTKDLGCIFE